MPRRPRPPRRRDFNELHFPPRRPCPRSACAAPADQTRQGGEGGGAEGDADGAGGDEEVLLGGG